MFSWKETRNGTANDMGARGAVPKVLIVVVEVLETTTFCAHGHFESLNDHRHSTYWTAPVAAVAK